MSIPNTSPSFPQNSPENTFVPLQPVTNRYKTMMCKHFESSGSCPLGVRCHFAHGTHELRCIYDPLPPQALDQNNRYYQLKAQPSVFSNYKTMKCKNYQKSGNCKYGQTCTFAHGDAELRKPTDPLYSASLDNMYFNPMGMNMSNNSVPLNAPQMSNNMLNMNQSPYQFGGINNSNIPFQNNINPQYRNINPNHQIPQLSNPTVPFLKNYSKMPGGQQQDMYNSQYGQLNIRNPQVRAKIKEAGNFVGQNDDESALKILQELSLNNGNIDSYGQSSLFPPASQSQGFNQTFQMNPNFMGHSQIPTSYSISASNSSSDLPFALPPMQYQLQSLNGSNMEGEKINRLGEANLTEMPQSSSPQDLMGQAEAQNK